MQAPKRGTRCSEIYPLECTLEMTNVLAALEENEAFVSTGQLPDPQKVTAIVTEAYEHFRSNPDGKNSDAYPALQRVGSNLFGICVVATGGNVFAIGDADLHAVSDRNGFFAYTGHLFFGFRLSALGYRPDQLRPFWPTADSR